MEFEKIEEYRKQSEDYLAQQTERSRQRASVLEEVQALKAEYEKLMRDSLVSGTDASKELDDISDKIAAAERTYERKNREYQVASTLYNHTVTPEDVIAAWNAEFKPQFKAEKFDPAASALLAAKLAYIDAFQAYREVVKEYTDVKEDVSSTLVPSGDDGKYRYKLEEVDFQFTTETDTHFVKQADLYCLGNGEPVRSIQYVKRGDE
ncbi:hypothetical protein [Paenibacillus sp. 23TSA30-6]|uniref:hypothetical protein n=1 Tax=Paenibacillus sp. 23TSA30-6 TaxID=2546104 RepID=UPI0017888D1B|nr:hypothetical protein [Paenibacillus sp. 23TSA30-6]MBE0335578.1 hypothetical protein [Paenibacillus sp. 23TSA30-6]